MGFDGGAEANDALAFARDMAEPDTTLILAEVFDPGLLAGRPERVRTRGASPHRRASHRAERVLGGRPFEPVVVAGTAARQLNRLAHETGADLIVVGSTHRGPIGRVLAGTVADRLLNGAPCAVAVAPRGYAEREGTGSAGPIVVGYNGTEESDMALEAGRRMAVALGATLRLLCGIYTPESRLGRGPYLPEARSWLRKQLDRAEAECPPEIDVEAALIEGEPAQVAAPTNRRGPPARGRLSRLRPAEAGPTGQRLVCGRSSRRLSGDRRPAGKRRGGRGRRARGAPIPPPGEPPDLGFEGGSGRA